MEEEGEILMTSLKEETLTTTSTLARRKRAPLSFCALFCCLLLLFLDKNQLLGNE